MPEQQFVVRAVRGAAQPPVHRVQQVPVGRVAGVHREVARVDQPGPVHPPGQLHRRVQGEPGQPVPPHRRRRGRGAQHPAQAAAPVGEGPLQQQPPHPLALGLRQHREQRQHPDALAAQREHRADRLAGQLGHPAALRIGAREVSGAGQLEHRGRGRPGDGRGVGERGERGGGDVPDRFRVGG